MFEVGMPVFDREVDKISDMKIARVFPRRTSHTPDNDLVFIGDPPMFLSEIDEVHISITFTWDVAEGERLLKSWEHIAPAKIGGPGIGMRGECFTPGLYVKRGVVFTSRGCPNKCWFCSVWKRDGNIRELPIENGWIVQDDNLLACSKEHFMAVIEMLKNQPCRAEFLGGLEAKILQPYHAEALYSIKPKQIFFAYDTPDDLEPLKSAIELCSSVGFKTVKDGGRVLRCFVLMGYPKDTFENATQRLKTVLSLGAMPMAMLWRDNNGKYDLSWRRLQREWARPAIIMSQGIEKRIAKTFRQEILL
jgi:hypothetical protein